MGVVGLELFAAAPFFFTPNAKVSSGLSRSAYDKGAIAPGP
jgi:hypothetical protein